MSSLQSQLLGHAQQLNHELEGDDQRLSRINHALEQATKERMSARNKRLHTRQEADGAYVRVKVLLERRKEVERQLQFRQRELRFLQQLQGQQRERDEEEREREELKAVLMRKDAEVRQLQDQLGEEERELGSARKEAQNLREELQRVTVELADKSAQVRQLEWTKSMLEICLKSGNTKVEMVLIQSSAATGSKEALHKEIKVLVHPIVVFVFTFLLEAVNLSCYVLRYCFTLLVVQCIHFFLRINCPLWRRSIMQYQVLKLRASSRPLQRRRGRLQSFQKSCRHCKLDCRG